MVYVLDSSALIHAYRHDFPPDSDPGDFWEWLDAIAAQGEIIIPEMVFEEVKRRTDGLYEFLTNLENVEKTPSADALPYMNEVLEAYSNDPTDTDIEGLDLIADPYLIAHALALDAVVITDEVPRPNATVPRNKQIPDICAALGVTCIRYPRFLWEVRANWT